jgi:chemotaxis protein MotB
MNLQPEIQSGKMQVRMESRGLVVSLSEASFFPSGTDSLDPSSVETLGKVAAEIAEVPNQIRAEGHTDSIPIHNARFRNNWDLSAARAITIMELLRSRWNVSPERLAVTGYAETAPLESNETPEGRARNRRVDIVILNSTRLE